MLVGIAWSIGHIKSRLNRSLLVGVVCFSLLMIIPYRFSSVWRESGLMVWIFCLAGIGIESVWKHLKRPGLPAKFAVVSLSAFFPITFYASYFSITLVQPSTTLETAATLVAHQLSEYRNSTPTIFVPIGVVKSLVSIQAPWVNEYIEYENLEGLIKSLANTSHPIVVQFNEETNATSLPPTELQRAMSAKGYKFRSQDVTQNGLIRARLLIVEGT